MADTADKYAHLARPEFDAAITLVTNSYRTLKAVEAPLRQIDDSERRVHSILPTTNPTLYRDLIYSKKLRHTLAIVRAGLAFIQALDTVKEDMEAESAND